MLEKHFQTHDLIAVATDRPDELTVAIAPLWLELIREALGSYTGAKNIFVEVGYGLAEGKELYRYLGGKVLYLGCDEVLQKQRIIDRGDEHLLSLLSLTPGLEPSRQIAENNHLSMTEIILNGNAENTIEAAKNFSSTLP